MSKKIKIKNILFSISIVLFGLYPLIPERYESYVPIVFIASSLVLFTSSKPRQINYKTLIVMSSVFAVFLISALFSDNKSLGFKKTETMASLIGMPIAFFVLLNNYNLNFKKIEVKFFYFFFASNTIFSLTAFYLLRYYRNPKFSVNDSDFFRNAISDIPYIGEHSIYVSLFLAISLLMGINICIYRKSNIYIKALISFGMIFIAAMLLLLMSKAVILALIVALFGLFIFKSKCWKGIIIGGALIIILGTVLIPKQNNRFFELFNKVSFEKVDQNNSTSIRFFILKSASSLAIEKPILGYGLGDVQSKLDEKYKLFDLHLPIGKYNSHNQYLFVWLSSGIFGLIIFIYYLVYITQIAVANNDYFLTSLIILYLVTFLFENVLSRQSGVILFAFLINFLIFKNLKIKSL